MEHEIDLLRWTQPLTRSTMGITRNGLGVVVPVPPTTSSFQAEQGKWIVAPQAGVGSSKSD